MANIKNTPSSAAHLSYSGFDLGQLVKFTSTSGELLPVYFDLLYPGDKVTCRTSWRTQTMPLDGPAMCNLTEHVEWFAVPLDQIYSLFSNMSYNIWDVHTSLFDRSKVFDGHSIPHLNGPMFGHLLSLLAKPDDQERAGLADAYFNDKYSPVGGKVSLFGTQLRLLEHLGVTLNQKESNQNWPALSPLLFCAYQKIYFDFYRLTDLELSEPSAYNLDKWYQTGNIGYSEIDEINKMITLRYRPCRKDFFTLNFVSPLYPTSGTTSFGPGEDINSLFTQWLQPMSINTYDTAGTFDATAHTSNLAATSLNADGYPLSPTAIRTAFAAQKLLEVTRRAGKHIDQQTLAHFGVKPSRKVTGEVEYIGGDSAPLNIGEVISTAETSEAALGQIAGKGFGKGVGDTIKFENVYPCPVILMAIYSCDVDLDWKQNGLDAFYSYVDLNRFYNPAFDNLGMQPLFKGLYNHQNNAEDSTFSRWQYRWQESKMKYNRTLGGLARNLDTWSVNRTLFDSNDLSSYLVSPFALDGVMFAPYRFDSSSGQSAESPNPEWGPYRGSTLFNSDPLIHEMYFDVKKSSTMSTYGLESL